MTRRGRKIPYRLARLTGALVGSQMTETAGDLHGRGIERDGSHLADAIHAGERAARSDLGWTPTCSTAEGSVVSVCDVAIDVDRLAGLAVRCLRCRTVDAFG